MKRLLIWVVGVLLRALRRLTANDDPKTMHFWFSWSAVRAGYCNENTCLIDGVEMPYTCCSRSADHGTKHDDLMYLGVGTIEKVQPNRRANFWYWGAA